MDTSEQLQPRVRWITLAGHRRGRHRICCRRGDPARCRLSPGTDESRAHRDDTAQIDVKGAGSGSMSCLAARLSARQSLRLTSPWVCTQSTERSGDLLMASLTGLAVDRHTRSACEAKLDPQVQVGSGALLCPRRSHCPQPADCCRSSVQSLVSVLVGWSPRSCFRGRWPTLIGRRACVLRCSLNGRR